MKTKLFFLLAMLIGVAASATVTVTPLSTDYSTNKVTFKVEWTNTPSAPYNNRVWVWIDFCPVTGTTSANSFSTATISNPAKTGGNGTVTNATERGFFIEYAAANAGTTVTATLSNASGKFNWCAYGSDYPPNVTLEKGTYTFKGTTDFIVSNPAQTVTTATIPQASLTVTASSTFTDATGCPGIGSLYCPYTGSDLYMDATHLCRQRPSGAQNWEAWIKDTRDNELYRIVKMPDNKWWLAQNVKLASYNGKTAGTTSSNCAKDECGRIYSRDETIGAWGGSNGFGANIQGICPNGWLLPSYTEFLNMLVSLVNGASYTYYTGNPGCIGYRLSSGVSRIVAAKENVCQTSNDVYGWASEKTIYENTTLDAEGWMLSQTADQQYWVVRKMTHMCVAGDACDYVSVARALYPQNAMNTTVRCIRTL
ncbi:MAG: hypothetical protein LBU42_09395 [Prevotellaceae bacterium]|jgi:uncharacterized protein (TIGR02145 family)|nr:hypothetical protein [Prevotellaceae bacterium]